MNDVLMTVEELADLLRTSKNQIYNLISKGSEGIDIPPGIRIGKRRLWLKSSVLSWLKSKQHPMLLHRESCSSKRQQEVSIRRA